MPLVVPQSYNRVELRRTHRRIDPEKQADTGTQKYSHHRHPRLHRCWEWRIRPKRQRHQEAQGDAQGSAGDTLHDGFHHELPQDVLLRRADRAPHANLPSPQVHTHQHHVHDDDTADDHRYGAHQNEHPEKGRADTAPQGHVTLFRADEENVFHSSAEVASRPQDQVCLILRLFKISGVRLDVDSQTCVRASHAEEHWQGDHDEVVLVLPKDAADLLDDPYHHEFVVPDANTLPDRVHAEKQLLHQRVADQADVSAVLGFRCREVAAKLYGARVNIRHARRLSVEVHVRHLFVAVSSVHDAAGGGAHVLASGAAFGNGAHVLELNLFELQRLDDDVEIGHCEGSARDLKDVCAKVGDLLFNVDVCPLHDSHDRDERGHTHGQPQHRERGAQLVRAQGAEALHKIVTRGEHRFGEDSHSLYQILRARTASSRATRASSLRGYAGRGAGVTGRGDPHSAVVGLSALFHT